MKLLFVHGSGGTKEAWYFQTSYFQDADAVNLPGHPEGKPCTSVEDYVDWVHGYIQDKGYQDVVLGGHSLGGAIVMQHALTYPENLKAIILIGTGARLRVHPNYLAICEEGIENPDYFMKEYVEPDYEHLGDQEIRWIQLEKRREVGAAVQLNDLLCCDKFDIMDKVQEIRHPTLVLCGSEDPMTLPKYTRYLLDKIPKARGKIIEGAGHFVLQQKPHEVNQAIEEFLKSL